MKTLSVAASSAVVTLTWVAQAVAQCTNGECPPVPVPEPSTLALLSAGAATLIGARWFRRK